MPSVLAAVARNANVSLIAAPVDQGEHVVTTICSRLGIQTRKPDNGQRLHLGAQVGTDPCEPFTDAVTCHGAVA